MRKLHECAFTLVILHCFIQWVDCTCDANCTCDILPAFPRGPHGCFNYGLCTKPYLQLINATATPPTYRWACTTPNDCVCVNGTSNSTTYACYIRDNQCANNPCGTDSNQHFVCTPGIGSYTCTCAAGYTGTNCDVTTNSTCAMMMYPCINGGTCRDTSDGGFNCTCPDRSHGERCEHYDFCANDQPCQNGAECRNKFDDTNFICKCTDDTQGRYCELSNAKLVRKSGPVCYFVDQAKLEDPNNYPYYFDDDHMTHEMCRDRMLSSTNVFKFYTISGNRCYLSYGQHLTSAVDTSALDLYEFCLVKCGGNSYQWCGYPNVRAYVAEFYIDGTDDNPCRDDWRCGRSSSRGLCINVLSTTVINTTTGYYCICAPGYTGTDCGDSIGDPCDPTPCQNNATCIKDDVLHTYTCDCTIGYYGDTCQFEKQCTASTCLNGGTCIDKDGTATCECLTYYHGDRCQDIDRCEYGNPCYNGTCVSKPTCIDPTAYWCNCNPGYTGVHCENETNECIPNNCQNFATCIDLFMDYECKCLEGTDGDNCEININDCEDSPCNTKDEKANCTDLIGGYTCSCSPQWVGEKCDVNVIIRDVLFDIYGEYNEEMVPMLEDLMKQPALIKDMVPYILGGKTYEERLNLSWTADDLFDWIAYEEERLDPNLALFMFNDIVLGNCFSFNKNLNANYSYNMRDGGTNNGLRAKIRMGQDEYVPWTDTAAILVFVASGTDYIFAESVRYNAEPGGVTIFDVVDTRYQRLGGKYGTCIKESKEVPYYYYPGTYSADDTYSQKAESHVLFQKDQPLKKLRRKMATHRNGTVIVIEFVNLKPEFLRDWCICPPACSNQLYQVTWTRTEYAQFLPECLDNGYINCTEEEMDTVHINIRMKSLEYSVFEEIPAMDFNKFISYLGGLLGVLMGISIISFIEFFFLFVRLASIIISGKNI